jgi:biopolymer transport protein ExbD
MAGGGNIGESSDNPVGINITAMVDIIFCLCLFFMCSLHFKQVEGKIDTWLPKDRGPNHDIVKVIEMEEIRIFMRWEPSTGQVIRKVGSRAPAVDDADLMGTVRANIKDHATLGKLDVPVIIDAMEDVPWQDVVHVMDLCKGEKVQRIQFAAPFERQASPGNR